MKKEKYFPSGNFLLEQSFRNQESSLTDDVKMTANKIKLKKLYVTFKLDNCD